MPTAGSIANALAKYRGMLQQHPQHRANPPAVLTATELVFCGRNLVPVSGYPLLGVLQQDEVKVLEQFADASVTKTFAWGKSNHWLLLGWKVPGWVVVAESQPPITTTALS